MFIKTTVAQVFRKRLCLRRSALDLERLSAPRLPQHGTQGRHLPLKKRSTPSPGQHAHVDRPRTCTNSHKNGCARGQADVISLQIAAYDVKRMPKTSRSRRLQVLRGFRDEQGAEELSELQAHLLLSELPRKLFSKAPGPWAVLAVEPTSHIRARPARPQTERLHLQGPGQVVELKGQK